MPALIHTHTHTIPAKKLYQKSYYAKQKKRSHTWVNREIKKGNLIAISVQGVDLVCEPKHLKAI